MIRVVASLNHSLRPEIYKINKHFEILEVFTSNDN